jgi:hypothetical protein
MRRPRPAPASIAIYDQLGWRETGFAASLHLLFIKANGARGD